MGIYSRFPLTGAHVIRRGEAQAPRVEATIFTPSGPIRVINVHPLPPANRQLFKDRNRLIEELSDSVLKAQTPVIVAGDLNTTTWSTHLQPLHRVAARADSGGTFPAASPLRIPIDHVFYRGLSLQQTTQFTEDYGTDHVPFITVLCH